MWLLRFDGGTVSTSCMTMTLITIMIPGNPSSAVITQACELKTSSFWPDNMATNNLPFTITVKLHRPHPK